MMLEPVSTEIDTKAGVVVHTVSGRLTAAAVTATLRALIDNPEFQPGMGIVWDLRRGTVVGLRADEIKGVVYYVANRVEARGQGPLAIVASQGADYGLGRMFAAYAERIGIERRVFRDLEEAIHWASRTVGGNETP
jgi:hypothetical protein